MSDDDEDNDGASRERSASYAGSRSLELLGTLRSAKHAGRIKALKKFQEYVNKYKPEFYDDDIELLLVGSSSLDGLIPWCGYRSQAKGEDVLKTTSKSVLQLVHWLVSQKPLEAGGDKLFLDAFLELSQDDLQRMELSMHIKSANTDDTEAFELLSLLLTRHKSPDGQLDPLGLEVLLPDEEAQAKFTKWLQQSASEQQLIDRIEKQRGALAAALVNSNKAKTGDTLTGQGHGIVGGAPTFMLGNDLHSESFQSLDPLGVNHVDLVSADQARPKSRLLIGSSGGTVGGMRGIASSSLLAAKERINLLQKLQQQSLGGASTASGAQRGKYTRNRSRALKATSEDHASLGLGASIVPQDENFDPVLFLTVVHGSSTFDDVRRGQENLEKAMGTQANQLQQLVRQHYDSFVRCADGIHWFKNMIAEEFIRPDATGSGSGGTNSTASDATKIGQLLEIVMGTREGARTLFSPLLERMEKTRSLRSARLMLQRLAKVLDVPGRMAKFEKTGQYEEVVREYERVRALPLGGGVHLLTRVQEQAEIVAEKLRGRLKTYLGSDAHPFEDLVEAADLLGRLGGLDEPLLHGFAQQAQLLSHSLDELDVWYGKSIGLTLEQKQQHLEDEEDEEREDEENSKLGWKKNLPASSIDEGDETKERGKKQPSSIKGLMAIVSPDGEGESDADSDFSLDDSVDDDGIGGMDYSLSYGLNSVEHEAASLRLNYVRRLVREALRFIPTLLRLANLVADELSAVRVIWEPGQQTFVVVPSRAESSAGAPRYSSASDASRIDEVAAASAVLDQVGLAVQRISKASRRAMFGSAGGQGIGGGGAVMNDRLLRDQPLEHIYFRETLRVIADLYDGIFNLEADSSLTKAVLPPLKSLVEDAQRRQTQSVLDRLAEEIRNLESEEDWSILDVNAASEPVTTVNDLPIPAGDSLLINSESDSDTEATKTPSQQRGTGLPQAFYKIVRVALEELSTTLLRPFWCSSQVGAGLDTCFSQFLRCLEGLSAEDLPLRPSMPKPPSRPLRLLALIGNCIQLNTKYIRMIIEVARRLFESESIANKVWEKVLEVHDAFLHSYLEKKKSELNHAISRGFLLKHKGLRANRNMNSGAMQQLLVPGYMIRILLVLVQGKTEVKEVLSSLRVLAEGQAEFSMDGDDENQDEPGGLTYVEAVMQKLSQSALQDLSTGIRELLIALARIQDQQLSTSASISLVSHGEVAHVTQVEISFLLFITLKPYVREEQVQACKAGLNRLKALAADGLDPEENVDGILDYSTEHLEKVVKMYVGSL